MSWDIVVIGSGINSLVCAALLARAGRRVLVLEQAEELGGAIRTANLTRPGFVHETFAAWHPLFVASAAYTELEDELRRRGLEYLNTKQPTGTLLDDGTSAFLTTSTGANAAELDRHAPGDGAAWERMLATSLPDADVAFGVLREELWSRAGLGLGFRAYRRLGRRRFLAFVGEALESCRNWVERTFSSPQAHALLAPWALHAGLGPDAATSGFMTKVMAVGLERGGIPVPRGGGITLVQALAGIVRDAGGELETGADVEQIIIRNDRAVGVRVAGRTSHGALEAVVANVTPTQLYGRLLTEAVVPAAAVDVGRRYRYGRAGMQIHLALSQPPRWEGDERLAHTAIVHVTPGLDGVSRAVNEADRGLLPAEATIVVGQPVSVDPSRAPAGASILWLQLQELPSRPRGDAAGELDVGDGSWTETLRERYADRILTRLARHVPNLESALLDRIVLSPADIEAANPNMVGGDIYSGSCSLDQNLLWRPTGAHPGHRTPFVGLYVIGASTHPGPGLGACSGTLVARDLLRRRGLRRLLL